MGSDGSEAPAEMGFPKGQAGNRSPRLLFLTLSSLAFQFHHRAKTLLASLSQKPQDFIRIGVSRT